MLPTTAALCRLYPKVCSAAVCRIAKHPSTTLHEASVDSLAPSIESSNLPWPCAPPCLPSPRIRRLQYHLLRCSVTNAFRPISNLPSPTSRLPSPPVAKPLRRSHEPTDAAAPGSGSLRLTEPHALYSPKMTVFRRKRPNPTPSQSRFRRICHVRATGKDRYYVPGSTLFASRPCGP